MDVYIEERNGRLTRLRTFNMTYHLNQKKKKKKKKHNARVCARSAMNECIYGMFPQILSHPVLSHAGEVKQKERKMA